MSRKCVQNVACKMYSALFVGVNMLSCDKPPLLIHTGVNANGEWVQRLIGAVICSLPRLRVGGTTWPTDAMIASSNGTFSALLAFCAGNSPATGEFPSQRPVTRSFDISFDLRRNKRLTKQSWGWRFETPSRSLWRRCNALWVMNWKSASITCINSQWRHMATNIWVTLAQLMACCLGAPNHYMNHSSLMKLFRIELGIWGGLLWYQFSILNLGGRWYPLFVMNNLPQAERSIRMFE